VSCGCVRFVHLGLVPAWPHSCHFIDAVQLDATLRFQALGRYRSDWIHSSCYILELRHSLGYMVWLLQFVGLPAFLIQIHLLVHIRILWADIYVSSWSRIIREEQISFFFGLLLHLVSPPPPLAFCSSCSSRCLLHPSHGTYPTIKPECVKRMRSSPSVVR
jgi:hypothetical protein